MAHTIEVIENVKVVLGEGPYWDSENEVLYFVDLPESTVLKYDTRTKNVTSVVVDKTKKKSVTFVIPVAGKKNKFIIGYGQEIAILTWDGISTDPNALDILVKVDQGINTRFNDGKADANGRLWAGTMAPYPSETEDPEPRIGSLYTLNKNGASVMTHLTEVGISNGLAWTSDNKIFYYVDSFNRSIEAFDYEIEIGKIRNRRVVFDLKKYNLGGFPDGLTIDKEDKLWLANYDGSAVHHVDPITGDLLKSIKLPAAQITSVAWGGKNLDELYVTSANVHNDNSPQGGRLFRITGLGTSGHPSVPVNCK